MDINLLVGILGLILSIASIVDVIYVRKKSNQKKNLVFEVIPPISIAEVSKSKGSYSLRVVYERENKEPVYIENAYMQLIRFANFGAIPITKHDLATTDRLRLEIQNGNVLDVSLSNVTRDVCQIALGKSIQNGDNTFVYVDFEFLDYLDGGLVQILCDTRNLETKLHGTIIGMSAGIQETFLNSEPAEVPGWGCAIGVLFEIGVLASVVFAYRYIYGAWGNVWILALPIIALIGPLFLFYSVTLLFSSSRDKFNFPRSLFPPSWYQLGGGKWTVSYSPSYQRELRRLKSEIKSLKSQLRCKETK